MRLKSCCIGQLVSMAAAPQSNKITKDVVDMLFSNIREYIDSIKRNSERLVGALNSRRFKEFVERKKENLQVSLDHIWDLSNHSLYECLVHLRRFIQDNEVLASVSNIFTVRSLELILDDGVKLLDNQEKSETCLLYTSPSPRDRQKSRMPSSA